MPEAPAPAKSSSRLRLSRMLALMWFVERYEVGRKRDQQHLRHLRSFLALIRPGQLTCEHSSAISCMTLLC